MKTKIIIPLLLILLVSCNKDKSDARKMVGTWKRSLYDFDINNIIRVDTVQITKNQFSEKDFLTQNTITRPFYVSNSNINIILSIDTAKYCYKFIDKNSFTMGCHWLQNAEFRLTKIK